MPSSAAKTISLGRLCYQGEGRPTSRSRHQSRLPLPNFAKKYLFFSHRDFAPRGLSRLPRRRFWLPSTNRPHFQSDGLVYGGRGCLGV